jgi:general secretion pathway protein C
MAPRSNASNQVPPYGLALIAVDGKPAKAFAVGSRLDDGLVLQSVGHRSASIGPAQGDRSVLLELPALPPAATGVLPAPGTPSVAVPSAPAMRTLPAAVPPPAAPAAPPVASVPPQVMQSQPVPAAVPPPPVNPGLPSPDNFRSQ